ncbi:MAG TPA: lysophospholipid acyltransferase family protein [Aquirhabdus sp.]
MCKETQNLTNFIPPSIAKIKRQAKALNFWFPTTFQGLENVDENRPALYVGNHTLLGHDVPPLILGLYTQKHIFLRGVSDRAHFRVPLWRSLIKQYGAFEGTRNAIQQLMEKKEHILIFPGGGREVMKNKGEAYQLFWKNRFGFIELALKNGYDIIPFAAIGGEEMLDLKYDSNDFKKSLLGKGLQRIGIMKRMRNGEAFIPLTTGFLGLPFIPRRQALEYIFCPRIETRHIAKDQHENVKIELRQQVADAIQMALAKHGK